MPNLEIPKISYFARSLANAFFKIFKFGSQDALKLSNSPNEPHIHNFEELLVGIEGKVEHFIDFKALTFKAPFRTLS